MLRDRQTRSLPSPEGIPEVGERLKDYRIVNGDTCQVPRFDCLQQLGFLVRRQHLADHLVGDEGLQAGQPGEQQNTTDVEEVDQHARIHRDPSASLRGHRQLSRSGLSPASSSN
jgi:hypothetical protein